LSLEAYQNTWLALMLAPQNREQILAESHAGLSSEEFKALSLTPQDRLEAISEAVQRGRISVLSASLPATLRKLISHDLLEAMAIRYAYCYPAAVVYPPGQGLYNWLHWLSEQAEMRESTPIQDLIAYELGLTQLVFYRKPTSTGLSVETSTGLSVQTSAGLSVIPGPMRSPRTGLIVASANLERLLRALESGQLAAYLAQVADAESESQPVTLRQGWLLARWGSDVERFPLHWSVYALLGYLDGIRSWEQAVAATVKEYPELAEQTVALNAWKRWFETKHFLV